MSKVRGSGYEEMPHIQGKRTPVRQQALREGIRGQADGNHSHREPANLVKRTTALSNSVRLSNAM